MATPISEEEIYQKARKRVEEKKSFFSHLAVYIVVSLVCLAAGRLGYRLDIPLSGRFPVQ
jgi:hypothetical protein